MKKTEVRLTCLNLAKGLVHTDYPQPLIALAAVLEEFVYTGKVPKKITIKVD